MASTGDMRQASEPHQAGRHPPPLWSCQGEHVVITEPQGLSLYILMSSETSQIEDRLGAASLHIWGSSASPARWLCPVPVLRDPKSLQSSSLLILGMMLPGQRFPLALPQTRAGLPSGVLGLLVLAESL